MSFQDLNEEVYEDYGLDDMMKATGNGAASNSTNPFNDDFDDVDLNTNTNTSNNEDKNRSSTNNKKSRKKKKKKKKKAKKDPARQARANLNNPFDDDELDEGDETTESNNELDISDFDNDDKDVFGKAKEHQESHFGDILPSSNSTRNMKDDEAGEQKRRTSNFDPVDEDDEEEDEQLLKETKMTRAEEKARLLEISQLNSENSFQYEDYSDDDSLSDSNKTTSTKKTVQMANGGKKNKKNKKSKMNGIRGVVVGNKGKNSGNGGNGHKIASQMSLVTTDSDEFDRQNDTRKKQSKIRLIIKVQEKKLRRPCIRKCGPCIWNYRYNFCFALVLCLLVIIGFSIGLVKLRSSNQKLQDIYNSTHKSDDWNNIDVINSTSSTSLSPSSDELKYPTQRPTFQPTGKLSECDLLMRQQNQQMTQNHSAANSNINLPYYTLVGCFMGDIPSGEVISDTSTSISSDGSVVAISFQTKNTTSFLSSQNITGNVHIYTHNTHHHVHDHDDEEEEEERRRYLRRNTEVHEEDHSHDNETSHDGGDEHHNELQIGMHHQNWTHASLKPSSTHHYEEESTNNTTNSTDYQDNNSFGWAISLSGDGDRIAVSSPHYHERRGRVQIYEYILLEFSDAEYNWEWTHDLVTGDSPHDQEGYSIDLSIDGLRIAVGAIGYDYGSLNMEDCGRVRVFQYNTDHSEAWTQVGNDLVGVYAGDQLGLSVSLSHHGDVVSASGWGVGFGTDNDLSYRGPHISVFREEKEGIWSALMKSNQMFVEHSTSGDDAIIANNSSNSSIPSSTVMYRGYNEPGQPSISLSSDGSRLSVNLGLVLDKSDNIGTWHQVFQYDNSTTLDDVTNMNTGEVATIGAAEISTNSNSLNNRWKSFGSPLTLNRPLSNKEEVNNLDSSPLPPWEPTTTSLSADGERVIFLSGAGNIHDYVFDKNAVFGGSTSDIGEDNGDDFNNSSSIVVGTPYSKGDWVHYAIIDMGDMFSDETFPGSVDLSSSGCCLSVPFVRIGDVDGQHDDVLNFGAEKQDIISVLYKIV